MNMKEMRNKRGFSQKQVGKMVGVSQAYISKIENGNFHGMSINKLEKLSNVFLVTRYEMLRILVEGE